MLSRMGSLLEPVRSSHAPVAWQRIICRTVMIATVTPSKWGACPSQHVLVARVPWVGKATTIPTAGGQARSHGMCYLWLGCVAQVLQDRLAAVELMLLQKPIVSGQFTSHAFRHFVVPLDPYFRKLITRYAKCISTAVWARKCSSEMCSMNLLQGCVQYAPPCK